MANCVGRELSEGEIALSVSAASRYESRRLTKPYESAPLDLTLFISCYNEAAYILDTLDTASTAARETGLNYEIIVIDDCSNDNSPQLIAQYIAAHPEEEIILRSNNLNKGWAQNFVDGAFIGDGKYYRAICGDNSESKDCMSTVFKAIGEADIIIPYYMHCKNKSLTRKFLSIIFTFIVNIVTGNDLCYYNGQAVYLRHDVLRWHSDTRGFGYQADTLCKLLDLGLSYKEVGIITIERRRERSNALTLCNLLSVTHTLIEMGLRRISNIAYKRRQ